MTWRERVIAARERGWFTDEDKHLACNSWTTCAVGEQGRQIPNVATMDYYGDPVDSTLWHLGNTLESPGGFGWAVEHDRVALAEQRLDEIEDRVLQLKRGA